MRPVCLVRTHRLRAAAMPRGACSSLLRLSSAGERLPSVSALGQWAERAAQPLRAALAVDNTATASPPQSVITRLLPSPAADRLGRAAA